MSTRSYPIRRHLLTVCTVLGLALVSINALDAAPTTGAAKFSVIRPHPYTKISCTSDQWNECSSQAQSCMIQGLPVALCRSRAEDCAAKCGGKPPDK
jgi:hypothetical protein